MVEELLLVFGDGFQRTIRQQVVFQVLHVGHAAEHGQHTFGRTGIAECPRRDAVLRVALLHFLCQILRHVCQSASEQRLHDDRRDAPLLQFVVEIDGIGIAVVDFVSPLPVEVVELYLHKVPLALVMAGEEVVEHLDIAMVGEAEILDASSLAFSQHEVEHAVVQIARRETLHASLPYGMEQIIVDVIHTQFLERVAIHLDRLLAAPRLLTEVRQLGGNEIFVARVATEGYSRTVFRHSLTVGRRRVEIVDAMLDGIVHKTIDHLLVDGVVTLASDGFAAGVRQSHHSKPKERHLITRLGIGAESHFAFRRFHLLFIIIDNGFFRLLASGKRESCGYCSGTEYLQEVSAGYIFIFLFHRQYII